MGGKSTSKTEQSQQSTTNPWAPTMGGLQDIIGQINGQIGNTTPNSYENEALNTLRSNAQQGNPYAPQIGQLATDLLGGGPDRSGMVNDAYSQYQQAAQPYLSQDYLDPYKNPAFKSYMDTTANDIQSRVNGMFAGAGRDMSGMNMQTLARGITEGTAPIFANQYNQNVATQTGLMGNMFNAGGQTAGLLSNMDAQNFANRGAGVAAAEQALQARDSGATGILNAEAARRNLPLSGIANISNLLLPIAGLGGQTQGTSTSNSSFTKAPVDTAMSWMNVAKGFAPGVQGIGTGMQYLGGIFSDRRLKDDIKPVGKLDNGLTVYSYRYKGDDTVMIGLMADEVEAVAPTAVGERFGFKTVDYGLAVRT